MHVSALPSSDERITVDWSAQNVFRPNVFAFGAAVRRKDPAGDRAHSERVKTNPYFFPLASPLLISMAWRSFGSPPPKPSRLDSEQV